MLMLCYIIIELHQQIELIQTQLFWIACYSKLKTISLEFPRQLFTIWSYLTTIAENFTFPLFVWNSGVHLYSVSNYYHDTSWLICIELEFDQLPDWVPLYM